MDAEGPGAKGGGQAGRAAKPKPAAKPGPAAKPKPAAKPGEAVPAKGSGKAGTPAAAPAALVPETELGVWTPLGDKAVHSTPVFEVLERRSLSPKDGREKVFSCIKAPDWANVLAVTPNRGVVMVRQFRHGTGEISLELPGGVVEPGQTPLETAVRELMEETGYSAENFEPLCSLKPNPALFGNTIHTFLATNAARAGETSFDENEQLAVMTVAAGRLRGLLLSGEINHALMVAAICYWLEFRRHGR